LLLRPGFEVIESSNKTGILRAFRQRSSLDLLIISASLEVAGDGLEVARQIRCWDRRVPLILIATNSSEELAIAALRAGVNDYFKQPFSFAEVVMSVRRCLANRPPWQFPAQEATANGATRLPTGSGLRGGQWMIGESPAMQDIKAYIGKVAATDSNLLITGETGTGKELVAVLIHHNSRRWQKPLVCINSAALPDNLVESELFGYEKGAFTGADSSKEGQLKLADKGTVFFDEIGDMSTYTQAKILRVIESKQTRRLGGKESLPLDIRILAATNQNLERLRAEEKFRSDLYFRLNVATIHLPPLRDRKEDLPALCEHYIREMNRQFGREVEGFTAEALEYLLRYDWPGNVRELKNLIEASFINLPSQHLAFIDLPQQLRRRFGAAEGLSQGERARLLSALFSTNWNVSKAAQELHWSRMTVYRKMERYRIVRRSETADDEVLL
jgi:DNA-binding NtrC family response regulator